MDDPIKSSAELAQAWQQQEAQAYADAARWLAQAARGEVPSNESTKEIPVDEPITFDGTDMMPLGDGNG